MARMIVTYRVMPEDSEIEYEALEKAVKETVESFDETVTINKIESVDVGFGLKAVSINFSLDEQLGSETLENTLKELDEVGDVQVTSMSRAMG